MKAIVYDWHTEIFLDKEEAIEHCKIGQGADCCIFLVVSGQGLECTYHNRNTALLDRFDAGLTVAKRQGCEKVKAFADFTEGEHIF